MMRLTLTLLLILAGASVAAAQEVEPTSARQDTEAKAEATSAADREVALIEAVKKGDLASVFRLLEQGVSPDATDENKTPALYWAVKMNRAEIVETLLDRHAQVDKDEEGTSLELAAALGRANLVKLLIAHHADVNHKDEDGHTVLMLAAMGANVKRVPAWLATKFLGMDDDPRISLSSMGDEHLEVVKMLLAAGADVNAQAGDCGLTPLTIAALAGNVEVGRLLLEHGARVDLIAGENSALKIVEQGEDPNAVQEMLDNAGDDDDRQALLSWLQFTRPGRIEFAAMLRKAGAKE